MIQPTLSRISSKIFAGVILLACTPTLWSQQPALMNLEPGTRITLLGNTFLEREQRYGHLELAIHLLNPGKPLVFRNIAWSGETVLGESRAYFGTPAAGYSLRLNHVDLAKPDILLLHYGANDAFNGPAGIAPFKRDYTRLINDLRKRCSRIILLTVPHLEHKPAPLPNATAQNQRIDAYNKAIRELATTEALEVLDLVPCQAPANGPYTENSMHFTEAGYAKLAACLSGQRPSAVQEQARKAIVAKNALFFHQYRPQNETYLRGFRKHEQGQNAAELPQFDPLIAQAEADIAALLSTSPQGAAQ